MSESSLESSTSRLSHCRSAGETEVKDGQPARAVQYFSDEYLEYCKQLTPAQILEFIDQFQRLHLARQRHATTSDRKPARQG